MVKAANASSMFKNLAIDFDKYTLAGYNVNTGDCQRPPDLGHQVFNDAGEKRYVMEISYIRNHGSCHVPGGTRSGCWCRSCRVITDSSLR